MASYPTVLLDFYDRQNKGNVNSCTDNFRVDYSNKANKSLLNKFMCVRFCHMCCLVCPPDEWCLSRDQHATPSNERRPATQRGPSEARTTQAQSQPRYPQTAQMFIDRLLFRRPIVLFGGGNIAARSRVDGANGRPPHQTAADGGAPVLQFW